MAWRTVTCPECAAPIRLGRAQRHCECVNCGSKYAVGLAHSEPLLTSFEELIAQGVEELPVQEVERRLNELDATIAQAESAVAGKHAQLESARMAYQARRVQVQQAVAPSQNRTYFAGLVAAVAWFLAWFVVDGFAWLLAVGLGTAGLLLGWGFHSKWLGAEWWGKGELHRLQERIDASEAELSEAYLQLEDCVLERELRQRTAAAVHSAND